MTALGIDPGYDRMGVAVVEKNNNRESVVYSTCIETDPNLPLSQRLLVIGNELKNIIATHQPDIIGIENIFFNKNVNTAIGVAQARGVALYTAACADRAAIELGPQEIKVALTGYGKSDKSAVTDMIKRLVDKVPESALDDEYDAIAVAVTALAHHR